VNAEGTEEFVLVTGATGRQGGSTVRALLAQGTPVHALVRTSDSAGAREIETLGARLVVGDLDDPESLFVAATGARAIFSVQMPDLDRPGSDIVQASNLITAAVRAGVPQFVQTSTAGAGDWHRRAPGWAEGRWLPIPPGGKLSLAEYFESKASIDQAVREAGFQYWTVVQPSTFMEMFVRPSWYFAEWTSDRMISALEEPTRLAVVAIADIGVAAAAAIAQPDRFHEVTLPLAGDTPTMSEIAATLSKCWAGTLTVETLSMSDAIAQGVPPEIAQGEIWHNVAGVAAEPAHAHALGLAPLDFSTWAHQEFNEP
jgi:uncharacterized protein YbjT (DUF2867 family)